MTSTNEELVPPPKPRASPFDYRNTDLVSRLLAATPPYLYNMPLVPHSFFFSEMLRSLVQAKAENANRPAPPSNILHKKSRKRSWTQSHSDCYRHKEQAKIEKMEMPPPTNWLNHKNDKSLNSYHNHKLTDMPLELTPEKLHLTAETTNVENHETALNHHQSLESGINVQSEIKPGPLQFPFSAGIPPTPNTSSDIILPPPPPVWYPPLYPTPYGIDPLHFFIDLRVSGHIYDRKNAKDTPSSPPTSSLTSTTLSSSPAPHETLRQTRHTSAFSVPSSRLTGNVPINLSNYTQSRENNEEGTRTKFDVKSMGFEKTSNKISSNYVMTNIHRIYKDLTRFSYKTEMQDVKQEEVRETSTDNESNEKESEEEKEKKVKDLRALIGLELVVDYMNHSKPNHQNRSLEENVTDVDSNDSPAVDVVALQDDNDGEDI